MMTMHRYPSLDVFFHMTNHYRKLKNVKSVIDSNFHPKGPGGKGLDQGRDGRGKERGQSGRSKSTPSRPQTRRNPNDMPDDADAAKNGSQSGRLSIESASAKLSERRSNEIDLESTRSGDTKSHKSALGSVRSCDRRSSEMSRGGDELRSSQDMSCTKICCDQEPIAKRDSERTVERLSQSSKQSKSYTESVKKSDELSCTEVCCDQEPPGKRGAEKAADRLSQSSKLSKGYPEQEYLQFALRITEDIIRNDLYSHDEMKRVFSSHIEANRGRLNMQKMLDQVDDLCRELSIPIYDHTDEIENNMRPSVQERLKDERNTIGTPGNLSKISYKKPEDSMFVNVGESIATRIEKYGDMDSDTEEGAEAQPVHPEEEYPAKDVPASIPERNQLPLSYAISICKCDECDDTGECKQNLGSIKSCSCTNCVFPGCLGKKDAAVECDDYVPCKCDPCSRECAATREVVPVVSSTVPCKCNPCRVNCYSMTDNTAAPVKPVCSGACTCQPCLKHCVLETVSCDLIHQVRKTSQTLQESLKETLEAVQEVAEPSSSEDNICKYKIGKQQCTPDVCDADDEAEDTEKGPEEAPAKEEPESVDEDVAEPEKLEETKVPPVRSGARCSKRSSASSAGDASRPKKCCEKKKCRGNKRGSNGGKQEGSDQGGDTKRAEPKASTNSKKSVVCMSERTVKIPNAEIVLLSRDASQQTVILLDEENSEETECVMVKGPIYLPKSSMGSNVISMLRGNIKKEKPRSGSSSRSASISSNSKRGNKIDEEESSTTDVNETKPSETEENDDDAAKEDENAESAASVKEILNDIITIELRPSCKCNKKKSDEGGGKASSRKNEGDTPTKTDQIQDEQSIVGGEEAEGEDEKENALEDEKENASEDEEDKPLEDDNQEGEQSSEDEKEPAVDEQPSSVTEDASAAEGYSQDLDGDDEGVPERDGNKKRMKSKDRKPTKKISDSDLYFVSEEEMKQFAELDNISELIKQSIPGAKQGKDAKGKQKKPKSEDGKSPDQQEVPRSPVHPTQPPPQLNMPFGPQNFPMPGYPGMMPLPYMFVPPANVGGGMPSMGPVPQSGFVSVMVEGPNGLEHVIYGIMDSSPQNAYMMPPYYPYGTAAGQMPLSRERTFSAAMQSTERGLNNFAAPKGPTFEETIKMYERTLDLTPEKEQANDFMKNRMTTTILKVGAKPSTQIQPSTSPPDINNLLLGNEYDINLSDTSAALSYQGDALPFPLSSFYPTIATQVSSKDLAPLINKDFYEATEGSMRSYRVSDDASSNVDAYRESDPHWVEHEADEDDKPKPSERPILRSSENYEPRDSETAMRHVNISTSSVMNPVVDADEGGDDNASKESSVGLFMDDSKESNEEATKKTTGKGALKPMTSEELKEPVESLNSQDALRVESNYRSLISFNDARSKSVDNGLLDQDSRDSDSSVKVLLNNREAIDSAEGLVDTKKRKKYTKDDDLFESKTDLGDSGSKSVLRKTSSTPDKIIPRERSLLKTPLERTDSNVLKLLRPTESNKESDVEKEDNKPDIFPKDDDQTDASSQDYTDVGKSSVSSIDTVEVEPKKRAPPPRTVARNQHTGPRTSIDKILEKLDEVKELEESYSMTAQVAVVTKKMEGFREFGDIQEHALKEVLEEQLDDGTTIPFDMIPVEREMVKSIPITDSKKAKSTESFNRATRISSARQLQKENLKENPSSTGQKNLERH